ncbi:ROK family transcriptional regulator [Roseomonas sp. BN140053]|uniref:ROK family transcriptional regulator n=1 Tax=Roseomonas sp. BN140053 TaxID=3391898 RepID=UPI0039EB6447
MTLSGTNLDFGHRFNRRVVLEGVRRHGPLSRAELARLTGLSAQTVSNIAEGLREAGLLLEARRRTGGRGQPPIDLAIDPAGAFSLGISFDHRRLVVVLLNLAGEVQGQIEVPVIRPTPGVVLPLIEAAAHELRARTAVPADRLWGAGVAIPALVSGGEPTRLGPSTIPDWDGFPLAARLGERLGLPVLVNNDAAAAAVGELLFGAGRELRDFFYLYLGAGIGGGLVLNGRPYRGAHGLAGELGHLVVVPGGRPCSCGNQGCLERYASLSAAQAALTGTPEGTEAVDPDQLSRALAAGDPRMLRWLEEAATHLRHAVANLENLLDPQATIIGGSIPDDLLDALLARLDPLPRSVRSGRNTGTPRVLKAAAGLETRVLGAASLAIFDGMAPDPALLLKRSAPDTTARPTEAAA